MTRRSTRRLSHGPRPLRKSLTIAQIGGPEPTWLTAEGYSYIPADSETNMLVSLHGGLKLQLEQLEDYIVERLEAKLAARRQS